MGRDGLVIACNGKFPLVITNRSELVMVMGMDMDMVRMGSSSSGIDEFVRLWISRRVSSSAGRGVCGSAARVGSAQQDRAGWCWRVACSGYICKFSIATSDLKSLFASMPCSVSMACLTRHSFSSGGAISVAGSIGWGGV